MPGRGDVNADTLNGDSHRAISNGPASGPTTGGGFSYKGGNRRDAFSCAGRGQDRRRNTLHGRILNRTDTDFSLEPQKGMDTQTIAYDQVLSVSQIKGGHSHKTRWIIIGVVAGVAVVAIVFAYELTHLKI